MTYQWQRRASEIDASVNFIAKNENGGSLEARYVQRRPEYFIAYLSSQTGCNQACRFCHLTQLKEVQMGQARIEDYHAQFDQVMSHYDSLNTPVERMNINMMARGEPLLNPNFCNEFDRFVEPIRAAAETRGIKYRINVSSIFPVGSKNVDLAKSFAGHPVTFYWSIYSLRPSFRKRWLPKADSPENTLARLAEWQEATGRDVVIHHALIEGENDRLCDHIALRRFLENSSLKTRLNLVRYNSFSERTGREASDASYAQALQVLGGSMPLTGSKIVPRVGRDVAASCGMFLTA
jgi:adenine C2-methylase RlmN of 23S rRNA A2503 and tRNA A37